MVTPVNGFVTPLLLGPAPLFVGPFSIGATGSSALPIPIPLLPYCSGRSVYFQALAFEPIGLTLSLTNVGDLLLR